MKTYLDIENWKRKTLFHHFKTLADPTFALVANVEVSKSYQLAKKRNESFFAHYLYACIKAINQVENLKYRIEGDKIAVYNVVHAGTTMPKPDNTFRFSQIQFSEHFEEFYQNYKSEQERVLNSDEMFPPNYSVNCIHSSAIPWVHFTSHKEPVSGEESIGIPQLSFGKLKKENNQLLMPVAINVNHALVDGYHVGQFFEKFQEELDKID